MADLSIIVPAADLTESARAVVADRDAEVLVAAAGFPGLCTALGAAKSPVVVVVADPQDPMELVPDLVARLDASPDVDVVLAARPRGTWRTRLAHLVATRPPAFGANGTAALRQPVVERVARVKLARADLPTLCARLDVPTAVLRDARVRAPGARPSLLLSGAAAQWLGLVAVVCYLLALLSFGVLSPGAARVVNGVMLVACALVACAGMVVHLLMRRAIAAR